MPEQQELLPSTAEPANPDVFKGRVFAITGTLEKMKRNEAIKLIQDHGGEYKDSVTQAVTDLLYAYHPGTKLKLAKARNLPLWTEAEFMAAISRQNTTP